MASMDMGPRFASLSLDIIYLFLLEAANGENPVHDLLALARTSRATYSTYNSHANNLLSTALRTLAGDNYDNAILLSKRHLKGLHKASHHHHHHHHHHDSSKSPTTIANPSPAQVYKHAFSTHNLLLRSARFHYNERILSLAQNPPLLPLILSTHLPKLERPMTIHKVMHALYTFYLYGLDYEPPNQFDPNDVGDSTTTWCQNTQHFQCLQRDLRNIVGNISRQFLKRRGVAVDFVRAPQVDECTRSIRREVLGDPEMVIQLLGGGAQGSLRALYENSDDEASRGFWEEFNDEVDKFPEELGSKFLNRSERDVARHELAFKWNLRRAVFGARMLERWVKERRIVMEL